jgi:predicted DNA-binding antitoxin AbrB/MazE fold protein
MDVIDAIYEHGVLRPLRPLALPEHTRVRVSIDEAAPERADRERLAATLRGQYTDAVCRETLALNDEMPVHEA